MAMAEERIWHLSLPKHANMSDGIPFDNNHNEAEDIWRQYASQAEQMRPGKHLLTPPRFSAILSTELMVWKDNFHGLHKIDDPGLRIRLSGNSLVKYMSDTRGKIVMIPEGMNALNVAVVSEETTRLYYMLRWLVSPTQNTGSAREELIGAGARRSEPSLPMPQAAPSFYPKGPRF